jgi:hypothetical protein
MPCCERGDGGRVGEVGGEGMAVRVSDRTSVSGGDGSDVRFKAVEGSARVATETGDSTAVNSWDRDPAEPVSCCSVIFVGERRGRTTAGFALVTDSSGASAGMVLIGEGSVHVSVGRKVCAGAVDDCSGARVSVSEICCGTSKGASEDC